MSADTKFFIAKFLHEADREVIAYGDSLNDYFMLKQADQGYLVSRQNGSISRSLNGRNLGGIKLV
jgi:soluble P-type ATPase